MLKILQINKYYYQRGGSERYFFELTRLLEDQGHQVIPFSMQDDHNMPSKYEEYFIKPVNVKDFNIKNIIKSFYNYEAVRKLKALIKNEKPDIAHLHNIANQISPAIIRVLKKNNIKIVQTLHDYKLICPNYQLFSKNEVCRRCQGGKYYNCFFRKCIHNSRSKSFLGALEAYLNHKILKLYDRVDIFIAPSRYLKDVCLGFGIPKEKIAVINNFISKDFIASLDNLNINAKNKSAYLLYFGRLSKEKGIDIILQALKTKNDNKLKIIGAGAEYKKIKNLIAELKLKNRVELLGPKYGNELKELIVGAKAVIISSVWPENMPYSLLESMAAGKTVIASAIGGIPEIIKDGENGFLFKPGDSADLAGKIDLLNQVNLNEIGAKARITIEKINETKHYQEIFEVYKGLLK